MRSPSFPAVQIGRRLYCDSYAFERWLEEHQGCVVWKKPSMKQEKPKKRFSLSEFNPVFRGEWR